MCDFAPLCLRDGVELGQSEAGFGGVGEGTPDALLEEFCPFLQDEVGQGLCVALLGGLDRECTAQPPFLRGFSPLFPQSTG